MQFDQLSAAELADVYQRFVALADRKKRIYDQDLLSLLGEKAWSTPQPKMAAAATN